MNMKEFSLKVWIFLLPLFSGSPSAYRKAAPDVWGGVESPRSSVEGSISNKQSAEIRPLLCSSRSA